MNGFTLQTPKPRHCHQSASFRRSHSSYYPSCEFRSSGEFRHLATTNFISSQSIILQSLQTSSLPNQSSCNHQYLATGQFISHLFLANDSALRILTLPLESKHDLLVPPPPQLGPFDFCPIAVVLFPPEFLEIVFVGTHRKVDSVPGILGLFAPHSAVISTAKITLA